MASPFLDHVAEFMTVRRYARRTVDTYIYWIRFYILFSKKQHPAKLGDADVELFLNYLANQRHVAPRTQATALNALSFLYSKVLQKPLGHTHLLNHGASGVKSPLSQLL